MVLPGVARSALGGVAVVNERGAVENRRETEYGARLRALDADVRARLQLAAGTAATEALARTGARSAPWGARRQSPTRDPATTRPTGAGRRGGARGAGGDAAPGRAAEVAAR